MRFGILLTSVHDASVDPRQQVREHEELVRSAEDLGFDLMVCGQHFLGSELRYYQPGPWLTHLSAVAPTMRAATGIILLSMVNPVDIAEQMSTLDVLSDGRAVFGVGLGYSAHEFDAFGVEPGTRVARFEESLRIVRAMWSGDEVDVEGRFHSVRGARPSVRAAGRRPQTSISSTLRISLDRILDRRFLRSRTAAERPLSLTTIVRTSLATSEAARVVHSAGTTAGRRRRSAPATPAGSGPVRPRRARER